MPGKNYNGINNEGEAVIANYVPGYDLIPARFGPPPRTANAGKGHQGKREAICGIQIA